MITDARWVLNIRHVENLYRQAVDGIVIDSQFAPDPIGVWNPAIEIGQDSL